MQEPFIALIEDDQDDVAILTECFKKYDSFSIKNFTSGQEFLDAPLNGSLPCLIVIDLNLPDIRGIQLVDHIKANPVIADVPIIIYTTDYTRNEQATCEELKIRLLKKPDTYIDWDKIALMMAQHCDTSL